MSRKPIGYEPRPPYRGSSAPASRGLRYGHRVPRVGLLASGWTVSLLEVGILPLEAADLAPEGVLSGAVRTPVNALLLRGHSRTILVDAG